MAEEANSFQAIVSRYASSLFELALADDALASVEEDLARFDEMLNGSKDLQRLVRSPVFSADQQFAAVDAILKKAQIGGLVGNFVRVVARNRRLFAMTGMLGEFRRLLADHRGEAAAEITVAQKLTATQNKQLATALKGVVGKDVAINEQVDPAILGGMIVKIGSRQIDTSIRTKLSSLKLALKEVG